MFDSDITSSTVQQDVSFRLFKTYTIWFHLKVESVLFQFQFLLLIFLQKLMNVSTFYSLFLKI
uniref:Uncharacterized protein n=1 Tax=Octopus bimaculoides TaxID=37653 RepID=A0A0L8GHU6_OCTBM